MDQLLFNDSARGEEIAKAVRADYNPRTSVSIVRVRDDVLLGGVVFYDFTGESIFAHIAGCDPHWITRNLLFIGFDYPFNQLGVQRIFAAFPADNIEAYLFDSNLGFREVARIDGVYPGNVTQIVMRMDRQDCRFLKIKPRSIKSNLH